MSLYYYILYDLISTKQNIKPHYKTWIYASTCLRSSIKTTTSCNCQWKSTIDFPPFTLYRGLERVCGVFGNLLRRVNNTFSKESSDCLSTLSTTLELLRLLVNVETPEEDVSITRTYTLTHKQLQDILQWEPNTTDHPLLDLEKLLEVKK